MARKKKTRKTAARRPKDEGPVVIEIRRHIPGPPRRSPGQTLRITREQIRRQGLTFNKDFRVVKTGG